MRAKFYFFFLLLSLNYLPSICLGQAPDWTRVLQVNTDGQNTIDHVTADANNMYSVASISGSITIEGTSYTSNGLKDLLIIKMNNAGTVGWVKQIKADIGGKINAYGLKVDASGNIFITGIVKGTATIGNTTFDTNTPNAFIAKFDVNGDCIWATPFTTFGVGSSRIAIDDSGNSYLISFGTRLIKFNSTGELQWTQDFPESTLQAIAVYGSNLYLGGNLKKGFNPGNTTTFGTITLTSLGGKNTGFIVKADLDGVYSNSIVVDGSTASNSDGSTVTDIVCDNSGNLIITGGYIKDLVLGTVTITNAISSQYTYIAKCNNNLVFSWAKSSTGISGYWNFSLTFRLFLDSSNIIYQYGMNVYSFGYETTLLTLSSSNQFLFKFDSNGNVTNGYAINNTYYDKISVAPNGKIYLGKYYNSDGSYIYGNFNLTQLNNDLTPSWEKITSNSSSGSVKINYIKHDSAANTYTLARIIGKCNYFGTNISSNSSITVISKNDINGNLLWLNQINDINPNLLGASFTLDKDNNILMVGLFKTNLTIGSTTLTTSNSGYEGYVAKYNSEGVFQWAAKMNLGSNVSTNITVATDNDGNVLVAGVKYPDNYIAKFDPNGNQLWTKSFPMESQYTALISTDTNNNIYLTSEIHLSNTTGTTTIGTVTLNQTMDDGAIALVKFDPDGNAIWANTYGGVIGATYSDGWACDIKTDAEGNNYLWGWCSNNSNFGTTKLTNPYASNQGYSFFLAKINTNGNVVWAKAVYESKYSFNYGDLLDLDKAGNIYVGGQFKDKISFEGNEFVPSGLNDFFTIKVSNNGTFQWIKTIPSDVGTINSLSVFDNDILSLVGSAEKNPTLGNAPLVIKGGSNCIVATLGNLKNLTVSTNSLTIASQANSSKTFDITSNISWTVSSNQTWLTPINSSGTGNKTITLTASENPLAVTRSATITVSGSEVSSQIITITQEASSPFLNVSSSNLTIAATANSTNTFNITTNISWTVSSNQTWLTPSNTEGSGNTSITLTAEQNPTANTRTATITVSGANVSSKTISVTQDAGSTGIFDVENSKKVNIFPNPSNGQFTLSLNNYSNEIIDVTINDALGNVIKKISYKGLPDVYSEEFNLSKVAKGLYFIVVKTNNSKFVKTISIINP